MKTPPKFKHEHRATDGRYTLAHPCDACGKSTNEACRYTDDEVCGSSDGPGFFLCDREACILKRDLPLEDRRTLYTEQRAKNDARTRRRRAS